MSFITIAFGQRADGLWSPELPLIFDRKLSLAGLPTTASVPCTQLGMGQWAMVKKAFNADHRRRYVFLYQPTTPDTQLDLKRVCTRWQGFVFRSNLRSLGNWQGKAFDAHSAKQTLILHGGNSPAAMHAQTNAVALIHDCIRSALSSYPRDYTPPTRKIEFQHMVFTRKTASTGTINTLRPEDDINGGAAQALSDWSVSSRVFTGRRTETGEIEPYPGVFFRRNDFVDVTAMVDIVVVNTSRGNRLRIYLDMQSVILLRRAHPAQQIRVVPQKQAPRDKQAFRRKNYRDVKPYPIRAGSSKTSSSSMMSDSM